MAKLGKSGLETLRSATLNEMKCKKQAKKEALEEARLTSVSQGFAWRYWNGEPLV